MGELVPYSEEEPLYDLGEEGAIPDVQLVDNRQYIQNTVVVDNSMHDSGKNMLVIAHNSVHEAHMSRQENNLLQQQQIQIQNIQNSDPYISSMLQLLDTQLSNQNALLSQALSEFKDISKVNQNAIQNIQQQIVENKSTTDALILSIQKQVGDVHKMNHQLFMDVKEQMNKGQAEDLQLQNATMDQLNRMEDRTSQLELANDLLLDKQDEFHHTIDELRDFQAREHLALEAPSTKPGKLNTSLTDTQLLETLYLQKTPVILTQPPVILCPVGTQTIPARTPITVTAAPNPTVSGLTSSPGAALSPSLKSGLGGVSSSRGGCHLWLFAVIWWPCVFPHSCNSFFV